MHVHTQNSDLKNKAGVGEMAQWLKTLEHWLFFQRANSQHPHADSQLAVTPVSNTFSGLQGSYKWYEQTKHSTYKNKIKYD